MVFIDAPIHYLLVAERHRYSMLKEIFFFLVKNESVFVRLVSILIRKWIIQRHGYLVEAWITLCCVAIHTR